MATVLGDVWWLCEDSEWLKFADDFAAAINCVIQLRCMSLDRRMERILLAMKDAERQEKDVTSISEEYQAAMKQKRYLQTKKGALEFQDLSLTKAFEDWKTRKDSLPL